MSLNASATAVGNVHAMLPPPSNTLVRSLLTDVYQLTMAYAYWKNGRHEDEAVFELFFRKNPFQGGFTVFAGLDECLKFLQHFGFTASDIEYLQRVPAFCHCEPAFWDWLSNLDASQMQVHAVLDGTLVFPRIPLLRVKGPLAVGQLLETTLLTLINYPTLLTTNATRMVRAARRKPIAVAGNNLPHQCAKLPICIEFGLRRAQGPDGGVSASKYAVLGGFEATSNMQSAKLFDLPVAGTMAHAFVQTFSSLDQVRDKELCPKQKETSNSTPSRVPLLPKVLKYRESMAAIRDRAYGRTHEGELAAFVAYAVSFPDNFLCLVDTYDTLTSGVLNFVLVALALDDLGYTPKGIRLDSGDLAGLSMDSALIFAELADKDNRPFFHNLTIVASSDINEKTLHELNQEPHGVTAYGIGTNLVTCQAQPALGCVYKLVKINGEPRMKLTEEIEKILIPDMKRPYRLYSKDGHAMMDVMIGEDEDEPVADRPMLFRHPFNQSDRVSATPNRVEALHHLVFDRGQVPVGAYRTIQEARQALSGQLVEFPHDLLDDKRQHKILISFRLYRFLHEKWEELVPPIEIS